MQPATHDLFGERVKSFDMDSLDFLVKFAAERNGASFGAEELVHAANEAGLSPRDLRNWGAVFAQAARLGYIARDYTYTFRRATSNGSLGVGWKPLIHSHKEKALSATN